MITVIIEGTKDIENTLRSLSANSSGEFQVVAKEEFPFENVSFFSAEADLYWKIPSGSLVLSASWDKRFELCLKDDDVYCLVPSAGSKYPATNKLENLGVWSGEHYIVPILGVTEV